MVTVDALSLTAVADGVIPVGADAGVFPLELVYQEKFPVVPFAILVVLTENVALAAVPAVIIPVCEPMLTADVSPPGVDIPATRSWAADDDECDCSKNGAEKQSLFHGTSSFHCLLHKT